MRGVFQQLVRAYFYNRTVLFGSEDGRVSIAFDLLARD